MARPIGEPRFDPVRTFGSRHGASMSDGKANHLLLVEDDEVDVMTVVAINQYLSLVELP